MLINGLLLGLSTGIFCLSYCVPIYIPLLLAEKRDKTQIWRVFLKFTLGRLIAYIIFGAVVGYLGTRLSGAFFQKTISAAMIILALTLIAYSLGLTIPQSKFCHYFKKIRVPFLLGFLTGINICPPFLLALTYGFKSGGVIDGILFFTAFFVGTTIYTAPFTFAGHLSQNKILRQIGTLSAFLVGIIFLILGLRG